MPAGWPAFPILPALLAATGTFWITLLFVDASAQPSLLPVIYAVALLLPAAGVALRSSGGPTTRRFWFPLYVLGALGLTFLITFTNQVYWPVMALINSAAIAEVLASVRVRPWTASLLYLGKVTSVALIAVILFGLSIFAPNPAGYVIAVAPLVLLAASPGYRRRKWLAAMETAAGIAYLASVTLPHTWPAQQTVWGSPVGYSGAAALVGLIAMALLKDPNPERTSVKTPVG